MGRVVWKEGVVFSVETRIDKQKHVQPRSPLQIPDRRIHPSVLNQRP